MIYDPYSRPFQEDPFPLYHHFLEEQPVHVRGFSNVPIRVTS